MLNLIDLGKHNTSIRQKWVYHVISKSIFWEKYENKSAMCRLLKRLPSVQNFSPKTLSINKPLQTIVENITYANSLN